MEKKTFAVLIFVLSLVVLMGGFLFIKANDSDVVFLDVVPITIQDIQKFLPPDFYIIESNEDSKGVCYTVKHDNSLFVGFIQRLKSEKIRMTLIYAGEGK